MMMMMYVFDGRDPPVLFVVMSVMLADDPSVRFFITMFAVTDLTFPCNKLQVITLQQNGDKYIIHIMNVTCNRRTGSHATTINNYCIFQSQKVHLL